MKLRRKFYSGYSEASPQGIGYHSAQVTADYILDPAEKVLVYIENSPVGEVDSVKRKTSRFIGPVKSIKNYINWKLKRKNDHKKK